MMSEKVVSAEGDGTNELSTLAGVGRGGEGAPLPHSCGLSPLDSPRTSSPTRVFSGRRRGSSMELYEKEQVLGDERAASGSERAEREGAPGPAPPFVVPAATTRAAEVAIGSFFEPGSSAQCPTSPALTW